MKSSLSRVLSDGVCLILLPHRTQKRTCLELAKQQTSQTTSAVLASLGSQVEAKGQRQQNFVRAIGLARLTWQPRRCGVRARPTCAATRIPSQNRSTLDDGAGERTWG